MRQQCRSHRRRCDYDAVSRRSVLGSSVVYDAASCASPELQDQLLREVWRVIEPGGVFVGSDSIQSLFMRLIHIGDTLVPVDPNTFGVRLEAAGFQVLEVEKNSGAFRFCACRPEVV